MKPWIIGAITALGLCGPLCGPFSGPAAAQDLIASYGAFIGVADQYNSNGVRLDSAAQMLRQDRANMHRFGITQPGDDWDPVFHDMAARARMEELLEDSLSPPTRSAIRGGNVYVIVEIYGYGGVISFIRVVVPG